MLIMIFEIALFTNASMLEIYEAFTMIDLIKYEKNEYDVNNDELEKIQQMSLELIVKLLRLFEALKVIIVTIKIKLK